MNSEFVIAVRKATRQLPPTDQEVKNLMHLRCDFIKEAEAIILKNADIGKRFVESNIEELENEANYTEVIVRAKLSEMWEKGLGDYDADYANTKDVINELQDAIAYLKDLRKIYFEQPKSCNSEQVPTVSSQSNKMKKDNKAIWLSTLIAAFGVAIGFLGELMPDDFKSKVERWSTAMFGVSFLSIWISVTTLIVLLFLWLVWREALKINSPEDVSASGLPKVIQKGDKSIFIEKNDGPINIH
jgi:hypothetical protein